HIAAAVACLRERVRLSVDADGLLLPAEPWLADGERVVSVKIDALGEQSSAMVLEGDRRRHQKPSFFKKLGFSAAALSRGVAMNLPNFRMIWRRGMTLLLAGLALVMLAGCSRPTPTGLIFNPAPWQDGEQHTFRLTDVDGNRAGTAT
ncbi:MAG: hypothetical protein KDD77_07135, partial [Caldilineaceae bacterium]|nr:hypothetical protein [Caldilineaceae bacterium]